MSDRKVIRARDVMNTHFFEVDGLATVRDILELMKSHGAAPIIIKKRHEDDEFGICLLSDISRKVLANDRSPDRVNVYEIMTKPVIFVRPEMDVRYCARLLEKTGVSVAPVLEEQKVLGIVNYENMVLNGLVELYA